jgi:hypothetical protein
MFVPDDEVHEAEGKTNVLVHQHEVVVDIVEMVALCKVKTKPSQVGSSDTLCLVGVQLEVLFSNYNIISVYNVQISHGIIGDDCVWLGVEVVDLTVVEGIVNDH